MTKKAKELIATSDKAWDGHGAAPRREGREDTRLYRKRYVAGVPKRSIAEEEADAREAL